MEPPVPQDHHSSSEQRVDSQKHNLVLGSRSFCPGEGVEGIFIHYTLFPRTRASKSWMSWVPAFPPISLSARL